MPIVRTSEVLVRADRYDEFMDRLRDLVGTFPEAYPGLVDHEVLVDRSDRLRVVYRSVWRDEEALMGFAGPSWETDPVTFPDEERLLDGGITLRHFEVDGGRPRAPEVPGT